MTVNSLMNVATDYHAYQRLLLTTIHDSELSLTQWAILARLSSEEGMRFTRLAHALNMSIPRLIMAMRGLQESGLVTVETPDQDRRIRLASLTASGKRSLRFLEQILKSEADDDR